MPRAPLKKLEANRSTAATACFNRGRRRHRVRAPSCGSPARTGMLEKTARMAAAGDPPKSRSGNRPRVRQGAEQRMASMRRRAPDLHRIRALPPARNVWQNILVLRFCQRHCFSSRSGPQPNRPNIHITVETRKSGRRPTRGSFFPTTAPGALRTWCRTICFQLLALRRWRPHQIRPRMRCVRKGRSLLRRIQIPSEERPLRNSWARQYHGAQESAHGNTQLSARPIMFQCPESTDGNLCLHTELTSTTCAGPAFSLLSAPHRQGALRHQAQRKSGSSSSCRHVLDVPRTPVDRLSQNYSLISGKKIGEARRSIHACNSTPGAGADDQQSTARSR